jgi:signal transduction histidine kinase
LGERVSEDWRKAVHRAAASDEVRPFFSPDDNAVWGELLRQGKSAFAMLFTPGSTQAADSRGQEILEELRRLSLGRLAMFGGAAADWSMKANYVFAGTVAAPDSILIAVFETSLRFGIAISHGLKPTSRTTVVTRASEHEVFELDGEPAADAYSRLSGIPRHALEERDSPLIAGQPLGIRDSVGQYTVNMISHVAPDGAMRMAQPVSEGTLLTLLTLVPDEMIAAGEDAMRKAILRSSECDPAVTFTCDCVLRPLVLGNRAGEEISAILRLTPHAPLVGFYSFGESGVSDDGANRHNNEAISMLLLGRELTYAATVARENLHLSEALAGANHALELSVREATAANVAAEAANRAKSHFLANISHELRTPLHGILSYAKFGLDETGDARLGELHEFFDNVDHCANTLLHLVNDLLDLSKLESGRMNFQFQTVDAGKLVEAVIGEFMSLCAKKQIAICYRGPEKPIAANLDPGRMQQVLRNLLSNAAKFSPASGAICVRLRQADNAMLLSVRDGGPGIPPDETEAVFDKFIQSSKTRSNDGGTGLGLAICREIVGGHRGKIWAENNAAVGCTFFVAIPLDHSDLSSDAPAVLSRDPLLRCPT